MGLLQNGQWVDQWYDTKNIDGEFRRQDSRFRNWITADGESGPNGATGFKAEKGRYHLYVSLACPWAHRTLIYRGLKQLEDYIDVTVVAPIMLENGWEITDPLYGLDFLYQLYLKDDPSYEGRVTVPVLWDKKTETIVSNESSEIIRMFNAAFNHLTGNATNYYPEALHETIHGLNDRICTSWSVPRLWDFSADGFLAQGTGSADADILPWRSLAIATLARSATSESGSARSGSRYGIALGSPISMSTCAISIRTRATGSAR